MSKARSHSSSKYKKHKLHWVHLFAVLFLGSYFLLSKANLAHALLRDNPLNTFMQMFVFGTIFSYAFLYIFSHDNFFPFAKDIEKKEEDKERGFLKKYLHHGKIVATSIIGIIGGPLFLSLTTRILLNGFKYKYVLIFIVSFISTIITFFISNGILNTFFKI